MNKKYENHTDIPKWAEVFMDDTQMILISNE